MAGKDYLGDYSNQNLPKKAIQASEIIYQASTLMQVATAAGVPTMQSNNMLYKEEITRGRVGEDDVQVDAVVDHRRLKYQQTTAPLKWTNYSFLMSEGAKLISSDRNKVWRDAISAGSEYFAAIRDYRTLRALVAGLGGTAAATANWDLANADIESDITGALQAIVATSNIQHGEKLSVVIPADVSFEIKKLTLIQNIQRTIQNYLEESFGLKFLAYRPMLDDTGSATKDGLEDDCLVIAQGAKTAKQLEYSRAAAANKDVRLVETSRVHSRGELYTTKMATGAIVTWDGVQTFSATVPLTARIYLITDVT